MVYRIYYCATPKRCCFDNKTLKRHRFDFLNMQCFKLNDVVLVFYHQNDIVLGHAIKNTINHAVTVALLDKICILKHALKGVNK